jgi:hypothetical protein
MYIMQALPTENWQEIKSTARKLGRGRKSAAEAIGPEIREAKSLCLVYDV